MLHVASHAEQPLDLDEVTAFPRPRVEGDGRSVVAFAASLAVHAALAAGAVAPLAASGPAPEAAPILLVRLRESTTAPPGETAAIEAPAPTTEAPPSRPTPAAPPPPRSVATREHKAHSAPALAAQSAPESAPAGPPDDAGHVLPAVAAAPLAGPTGAPRGDGGADADAAIESYVAELRGLVRRAQRYPALARRHRLEGVVLVRLVIQADGSVERADADDGAPEILARSAIDAIERASPFPPPPSAPFHVELPIRWRLKS